MGDIKFNSYVYVLDSVNNEQKAKIAEAVFSQQTLMTVNLSNTPKDRLMDFATSVTDMEVSPLGNVGVVRSYCAAVFAKALSGKSEGRQVLCGRLTNLIEMRRKEKEHSEAMTQKWQTERAPIADALPEDPDPSDELFEHVMQGTHTLRNKRKIMIVNCHHGSTMSWTMNKNGKTADDTEYINDE
jgi:hypothetical protein